MRSSICFILLCFSYIASAANSQASETPKSGKVATYKNWSVYVLEGPKTCWVEAILNEHGAESRLRFTYFQDGGKREPSYYTSNKQIESGKLIIGRNAWDLLSIKTDTSWVKPEDDIDVFGGLWTGVNATVEITTTAGHVEPVKLFSLSGFAAASRDAQQRCGM
jgi:hypothetical protein